MKSGSGLGTRLDELLTNSTPMDPPNATDSSPGTRRLSSLACLTSVCSDRLPSCLAPALQSRSGHNLSLALRFIGVQLHGEESSVTIHCTEQL